MNTCRRKFHSSHLRRSRRQSSRHVDEFKSEQRRLKRRLQELRGKLELCAKMQGSSFPSDLSGSSSEYSDYSPSEEGSGSEDQVPSIKWTKVLRKRLAPSSEQVSKKIESFLEMNKSSRGFYYCPACLFEAGERTTFFSLEGASQHVTSRHELNSILKAMAALKSELKPVPKLVSKSTPDKKASTSREIIKKAPKSPEIILVEAPNSPEINQEASISPEIIQKASTSPEIIQKASTSPEIIQKASSSPEIILVEAPNSPEINQEASISPEIILVEASKSLEIILVEAPTSPEIIQKASISPEIIQKAPKSFEISQEVPTSLEIIQKAPKSFEISQEVPTSLEIILKAPKSPKIIQKASTLPEIIQEPTESIVKVPKLTKVSNSILVAHKLIEIPKSQFTCPDFTLEAAKSIEVTKSILETPQSVEGMKTKIDEDCDDDAPKLIKEIRGRSQIKPIEHPDLPPGGFEEISCHKFRAVFCSICHSRVQSVSALGVHLQQIHNIDVRKQTPAIRPSTAKNDEMRKESLARLLKDLEEKVEGINRAIAAENDGEEGRDSSDSSDHSNVSPNCSSSSSEEESGVDDFVPEVKPKPRSRLIRPMVVPAEPKESTKLRHFLEGYRQEDGSYHCPHCLKRGEAKSFATVWNVMRHVNNFHNESKIKKSPVPELIQIPKQKSNPATTATKTPFVICDTNSLSAFIKICVNVPGIRDKLRTYKSGEPDGRLICPHCPSDKYYLLGDPWKFMRHLIIFHTNSDLIPLPFKRQKAQKHSSSSSSKKIKRKTSNKGSDEELNPEEEAEELSHSNSLSMEGAINELVLGSHPN